MCIIVAKERGIAMPERGILKNCFNGNPDGAGFMYNYRGEVIIQKGFMTWNDFDKALSKVETMLKDTTKHGIVFHFRITTQGGTNPQNCHPFPISRFDYELQQTYIKTKVGVVHNGIISLTSKKWVYDYKLKTYVDTDTKLSDTQLFIRDYMTDIYDIRPNFYQTEAGLSLIETLIDSKMTFLDKNGEISYVGKFNSDKNGVMYSNYSWEYKKTYYTTPYNYDNGFDDKEIEEYYRNRDNKIKTWNGEKKDIDTTSIDTKVESIKVKLMKIEDKSYWWNSKDNGDFIEGGNFGIDSFGYLYKIDEESKECYQYIDSYVTVFSQDGYEIDYDDAKASYYDDIEALDIV